MVSLQDNKVIRIRCAQSGFVTTIIFFLASALANAQIVTDIDGNVYKTVTIGAQVWMAENLKSTRYNDGTAISLVTEGKVWAIPSTPAYCWYNNDEATNKKAYGALYNWYAVDSASNGGKNVCPVGWHLPPDSLWTILTDYLVSNGYGYGGSVINIAKSMAYIAGWSEAPGEGEIGYEQAKNNTSGFAALPSGYRDFDGTFDAAGSFTGWWAGTEYGPGDAWSRVMIYSGSNISRQENSKEIGYSVRCVRKD